MSIVAFFQNCTFLVSSVLCLTLGFTLLIAKIWVHFNSHPQHPDRIETAAVAASAVSLSCRESWLGCCDSWSCLTNGKTGNNPKLICESHLFYTPAMPPTPASQLLLIYTAINQTAITACEGLSEPKNGIYT